METFPEAMVSIDLTEDSDIDTELQPTAKQPITSQLPTILGKHPRNSLDNEEPLAKKRKLNGTLDGFVIQASTHSDSHSITNSNSNTTDHSNNSNNSHISQESHNTHNKAHKHKSKHKQKQKPKSKSKSNLADSERESSIDREPSYSGSIVSSVVSKSPSKPRSSTNSDEKSEKSKSKSKSKLTKLTKLQIKNDKQIKFSVQSIKKLLKSDKKLKSTPIAKDAAIIIGEATKMFIKNVVKETLNRENTERKDIVTKHENENTNDENENENENECEISELTYDNIAKTINNNDKLKFLQDIVPKRVTLQQIISERQAHIRQIQLQHQLQQMQLRQRMQLSAHPSQSHSMSTSATTTSRNNTGQVSSVQSREIEIIDIVSDD